MKKSLLALLTLAILPMSAFAATNTICGTAKSIDGVHSLVTSKGTLAVTQAFVNQTNQILTKTFKALQNNGKYCVNTKVSKTGKILKVVGAYPQGLNITTFCGVRGGTLGLSYLDSADDQTLILGSQLTTDQFEMGENIDDSLYAQYGEGTQNGKSYCVNSINSDGNVKVFYGVFPN